MEQKDQEYGERRVFQEVVGEARIPMFCGRPCRSRPISTDDVTNLVIALNTACSLEEFLEVV